MYTYLYMYSVYLHIWGSGQKMTCVILHNHLLLSAIVCHYHCPACNLSAEMAARP